MMAGLPERLGRYELVGPLGRGASGQVIEAVLHGPAGFRKHVALKLMRAGPDKDAGSVAALVREARLGGLVSHPNVVSTLELGQEDGIWFVSMELVRGGAVSRLLRDHGTLPPAAVVDVGLHACAGLAHVHNLGEDGVPLRLVHRDVKPANLLLDASGLVRLADFGISGLQAKLVGKKAGTPGYMPPEQVDGHAVQRSDLFALGMSLLRLVTGNNPLGHGFEAVQAALDIESHLARKGFLGPADQRLPGLADVLHRCLRADPADRWRDSSQLAEALRALRPRARGASIAELATSHLGEAAFAPTAGQPSSSVVTVVLPTRTQLPRLEGGLVGRDAEVEVLLGAVAEGGLATLRGPAGVGKTRLAVEVAQRCRGDRQVVFCELASAHTASAICVGLVRALGGDLREGEPTEQVGRMLAGIGPGLVVLDNLEQVVEQAAAMLQQWRVAAPAVAFLLTSRAPLRLAGERVFDVAPLPIESGLVLFAERRGRPLGPAERATAEELVRRVDGLPLAIELLAARGRIMSCKALLDRLEHRFRLLAGGPRDADPRHRTLQAAIAWSWDLLCDWEQSAMAQLSVFEGRFSLEAAEAVLDLSAFAEAPWTLDVLASLQDHSLLRVRSHRFDLLQSVRAFAAARLAEEGATAAAERRHGAWFANFGSEAARAALRRDGGGQRMRALRSCLPDLVAAAQRAVGRVDGAVAVPATLAALEVLALQGPASLAIELADAGLSLPLPDLDRAQLLERAGDLRNVTGDVDGGLVLLEEALALFRAAPDAGGEASTLCSLGMLHRKAGRMAEAQVLLEQAHTLGTQAGHRAPAQRALLELGLLDHDQSRVASALARMEEALAVGRAEGDLRAEGVAWANIGIMRQATGDNVGAAEAYERSLVVLRGLGDRRAEAIVLANLGVMALMQGDRPGARTWLEQARTLHRRFGSHRSVGTVTANLGVIALDLGELDEARTCFETGLSIARETGDVRAGAVALGNLGQLHAEAGRPDDALACWAEALEAHASVGNRRSEVIVRTRRATMLLSGGATDAAETDLLTALGVAQGTGLPTLLGLAERGLGRLRRVQGDRGAALAHLESAAKHLAGDSHEIAQIRAEQGLLADDPDRARALLREAEALLPDGPWPASTTASLRALRQRLGEDP